MTPIPKSKKKPKPSSAKLKKLLDALWSEYIRRRDAVEGNATCVTCQAGMPWKRIQCGHFLSRVHLAGRWLETNTFPQCYACNVLRRGNGVAMAIHVEKTFGFAAIQELEGLKRINLKITSSGYEEKISEVRSRLARLDERERMAA